MTISSASHLLLHSEASADGNGSCDAGYSELLLILQLPKGHVVGCSASCGVYFALEEKAAGF